LHGSPYAARTHEASERRLWLDFCATLIGMLRLRRLAALWLLGCLALPSRLGAQPEPEAADDAEVAAPVRLSVISRFSVTRIGRWLASENVRERLRGIERLAEVGTPAALGRLTAYAFERRAQLVGREWLTLARALGPHAADPKAELVLAMLVNQSPSSATGPEEAALLELARGAAALALAADGGPTALLVLGRALRAVGAPAAAAADALHAHPPASIAALLDAPGEPSVELARLLGELGDQRAFHALRDWVRGKNNEVRAASAIALTRLGDLETVQLGALWLERGPPELGRAGLEILLLAHDPRAEPALVALLSSKVSSSEVSSSEADEGEQRLLLESPSPTLSAELSKALDRAGSDSAWRWTLLGRVGGEAAAERLLRGLAAPESALSAAHALSRLRGAEAHAALSKLLDAGVILPLGVRVAAARSALGESYRSLPARIDAWLGSADPSERAAAAWARSLDGGGGARSELESGDEVRVLAAASNALRFDAAVIDGAAQLLSRAPPGRVRTALGVCLLSPRARRAVSSELLWSLVAEAGAARPLALRALAARGDPGIWASVASYLDHPDPLLREHVARGLGESELASAVGYLAGRLEFETDETVRRALVMALGGHHGRAVSQWLDRAARLDSSARVRSAARLALAGVPLGDAVRGDEILWTEVRSASPAGLGKPEAAALLSVAPGLSLPVFADPAGVLVVSGLPASHLGIRLQ
jgi:HEAT repeats